MKYQEQLLAILYDLSQTINSEIRLQPLLKKFLQRMMYHTGYSSGLVISQKKNLDGSISSQLNISIGDRLAQNYIGQNLNLPLMPGVNDSDFDPNIILKNLPIRQNYYHQYLIFPIADYGFILHLTIEADSDSFPYQQAFTPIMANLSHNIKLCQHSEAYLESLIEDRDKARRDNEQFRQALDTTSDIVLLIDVTCGEVIDFNHQALTVLRCTESEILKLQLKDLLDKESAKSIQMLLTRLETQGE